MSTPLHQRMVDGARERGNHADRLTISVWAPTPWMVDVYTGSEARDGRAEAIVRHQNILHWCYEHFGDQSSPIHGHAGTWHQGGATIGGWTWFGFATEEQMHTFMAVWGEQPEPAAEQAQ